MTDFKHIIEPERMGLWTAAAFILALLALVMALAGVYRTNDMMAATQLQILTLNKKIEGVKKEANATPAPVAEESPEAPAAPAEQAQ